MIKWLSKTLLTVLLCMSLVTMAACTAKPTNETIEETPATLQPTDEPSPTPESEQSEDEPPEAEPTAHVDKLAPDQLPQFLPMEDGEDIAVITTSLGEIRMRFFKEYAPLAVENFITLANDDYYKDMIFHRVIDQFMVQTGDPTGTGTGGDSIYDSDFATEVTPHLHFFRGAVGMARGEDYFSNSSQFFIVQNTKIDDYYVDAFADYRENQDMAIDGTDAVLADFYPIEVLDRYDAEGGTPFLDLQYTVFGHVYEGMEVVDAIAVVETDDNDKPLEDISLISIEIQQYQAQD